MSKIGARKSAGKHRSTTKKRRHPANRALAPAKISIPRLTETYRLQAIIALGTRRVRDIDLIDALWPDAEGNAGRRVFDTTLHRLRRQMGNENVIRLYDGRVSLDERLCWVDTLALEGGLGEVARQIERRAPVCDLAELARRLRALYRGPLLADHDLGFVLGPREKIAARFRHAAARLAASLESRGELDDARVLHQLAASDG